MIGTPEVFADRPEPGENDPGLLEDMLRSLRLTGSVFMTACFSRPFDVCAQRQFDPTSPQGRLRHVSIFHMITAGEARIQVADAPPCTLSAGDVIWIPMAHQHRIYHGQARPAFANDLFRPGPLAGMWTIDHGGGGDELRMVCGWIETSEFLLRPMFRSLPSHVVSRMESDQLGAVVTETLRSIISLALAATPGTELLLGRMMETLFVAFLRRYATELPPETRGWFAALRDPVLARVIRLVHDDPARHWTVEELGRAAGISRSGLGERFQEVMGRSPIDYIASWRMQVAAERLRQTGQSLATVAADVGYESEAAFSRAFKRIMGLPPGRWRETPDPRGPGATVG